MDKDFIINQINNIDNIGELSDGYHTFNSLYYQRMILFASLVKQNNYRAWKTYRHDDGKICFGGGWFLVGIETPLGIFGIHFDSKYWDYFQCEEIYQAPYYDGYIDEDVTRLLSL